MHTALVVLAFAWEACAVLALAVVAYHAYSVRPRLLERPVGWRNALAEVVHAQLFAPLSLLQNVLMVVRGLDNLHWLNTVVIAERERTGLILNTTLHGDLHPWEQRLLRRINKA